MVFSTRGRCNDAVMEYFSQDKKINFVDKNSNNLFFAIYQNGFLFILSKNLS